MINRYWIDFEFAENGRTIDPISVGIVSDDDRELYLINNSFFYRWKIGLANPNKWVVDNVLDKISYEDRDNFGRSINVFTKEILDFISRNGQITSREDVELWGHYAAYDHVCLAQLWGPMINLPEPIPMYMNDDMTIRGLQNPPSHPAELLEHNSLHDAKFQKLQWEMWSKNE